MSLLDVFLQRHPFDVALTLQDSMYLTTPLPDLSHVVDIQYLWHFTNHRLHWSTIQEPDTPYNRIWGIHTHDDLVLHCISLLLTGRVKDYALATYGHKNHWVGCFGCLCVISHSFLVHLDKETSILSVMRQMTTNRLRRAIESIFPLVCQYALGRVINTSWDGLYYDGVYHNNFHGTYVTKQSFNRQ